VRLARPGVLVQAAGGLIHRGEGKYLGKGGDLLRLAV